MKKAGAASDLELAGNWPAKCRLLEICLFTFLVTAAGHAENRAFNPALNPVAFHPPGEHASLTLVRDGKARFAIVFDTGSEQGLIRQRQSIHLAVDALHDAFKRTAGCDVPVVSAADTNKLQHGILRLLVGRSSLTDELGIDVSKLPQEGFVVRSFPGGIAIAGWDGSLFPGTYKRLDDSNANFRINGTLWGAYDFIERFLGMRYYYPGIGVHAPRVRDLIMEPVHYSDAPVLPCDRSRWNLFHGFGRHNETWPWDKDRFPPDWTNFRDYWRLGNRSRFIASHTPLGKQWAILYGETRPDLFYRDRSGKLYMSKVDNDSNLFDISNPAVAEQYIRDCQRFYAKGWDEPWKGWFPPNQSYIPFGQCDRYQPLDNERTKDLLDYSRGLFGVNSEINAQFYVRLAELAQRELPDKRVVGWAYADYRLPPRRAWTFPKNLDIHQCHLMSVDYYRNQDIFDIEIGLLREWSRLLGGRKVGGGLYFGQGFGCLSQIKALSRYFRAAAPYLQNVQVWTSGSPWGESYFVSYVLARLCWNPRFDVDAALQEHYQLLYGNAAPAIREFFGVMIDRWEAYVGSLAINKERFERPRADMGILYGQYFTPAVIAGAQALLDRAKAAVPAGSLEAMRVDCLANAYAKPFAEATAFASASIPTCMVYIVSDSEIAIDGRLSEPCWRTDAGFPFTDAGTGAQPAFPSRGHIRWNPEYLYLAFACCENHPRELKTQARNHDDVVWTDDGIEVFLSPGGVKDRYYQVAVNTAGVVFDAFKRLTPEPTGLSEAWNCEGLVCACAVETNQWTLEMRIPFSGLETAAPSAGDVWHANVVRNKRTDPSENTAFSLTLGNNHNAQFFGVIKFADGDK